MANALYAKGKEALLTGQVSWNTDNIKAVLVDLGAYTPSLASDQYLSAIASGARVATSANLTGKTAAGGVADAADIQLPAVSGASVEAIVIYKDTGSAASSPLLAYIDTAPLGLPITPNGGNIDIAWNPSGIFKL